MRVRWLFLLVLSACSRSSTPSPTDGGTSPLPDATSLSSPTTSISDGGFTLTSVLPVEARHEHAAKLADVPLAQLGRSASDAAQATAILEKHFAGASGPFDLQIAALTATGRRALFVMESGKPTSQARPLLLVLDDAGGVVWSRERPVAGITPPLGPVALAAAPKGRVAIAAYDPPTSIVALRLLDDDGSPFADLQAITSVASCDALALLYWPHQGWVIVAAGAGATRARLVDEDGAARWGDGIDIGVRSRAGEVAAPSLAAITDDSFALVQIAQPTAAPGSPYHALAFRYDALGVPLWKEAVDLGEVARASAGEKPKVVPLRPGVRVTLPGGAEIDVLPSGDRVTNRARR